MRDSVFEDLQLSDGKADCQRCLQGSGWGQGLATGVRGKNKALSSGILIENVDIRRSWGEAIDPLDAEFVIIRNNRISQVWSVGAYLDNTRHGLVEKNSIQLGDPAFFRHFGEGKGAASCVGIGTEHWYPDLIDDVNITISTNLCLNSSHGISGYSMGHTSSGIRIEGNTIWGATLFGIDIPSSKGRTSGNHMRNNLIHLEAGAVPLRLNDQDRPHWNASSNVWVGATTLPIADTGASSEPPSQVIAAAAVTDLFEWGAGCGKNPLHEDPACFRPRARGALDSKGAPLPSDLQTDFFGKRRSAIAPSVGFAEVDVTISV